MLIKRGIAKTLVDAYNGLISLDTKLSEAGVEFMSLEQKVKLWKYGSKLRDAVLKVAEENNAYNQEVFEEFFKDGGSESEAGKRMLSEENQPKADAKVRKFLEEEVEVDCPKFNIEVLNANLIPLQLYSGIKVGFGDNVKFLNVPHSVNKVEVDQETGAAE